MTVQRPSLNENRLPLRMVLWLTLLIAIFQGCACEKREKPGVPPPALIGLAPKSYPVFQDDLDFDGLAHGLNQSLTYLNRLPADRVFQFGNEEFTSRKIARGLTDFRDFIATQPSVPALNQYIRDNLRVYRAAGTADDSKVLFTGYYEPLLEGRAVQDGMFQYPVYGLPQDLAVLDLTPFGKKFKGVKLTGRYTHPDFVPYHDRRAIDLSGVLADKAPVLAWVKDPVDLFFLHIQGSGKIQIPSQEALQVHYAAANGRPYRSIGRLLIDTGKIPREEMSMQRIRAYLAEHPEERDAILYHNPSYVFFQLEEDGPVSPGRPGLRPHPGAPGGRRRPHRQMDAGVPLCFAPGHRRGHQGCGTGGSFLGQRRLRGPGRRAYAAPRRFVFSGACPLKQTAGAGPGTSGVGEIRESAPGLPAHTGSQLAAYLDTLQ